MTQVQKDSAVWITHKGRNTWGLTFGEKGNTSKKKPGGRNLLFAGRAQGDCPPGPVAPPPGACDNGGLGDDAPPCINKLTRSNLARRWFWQGNHIIIIALRLTQS